MKLESELINGTTLITETAVEGFHSLLVGDDRVARRVATWDTEQEARVGHARLTRELTADIASVA